MVTVCFDSGRTYAEMVADPATQAKWTQYIDHGMEGEPTERWKRHTARAVEYLSSPHLANKPVKLLCETQILPHDYTQVRSEMHEPYVLHAFQPCDSMPNLMSEPPPSLSLSPCTPSYLQHLACLYRPSSAQTQATTTIRPFFEY